MRRGAWQFWLIGSALLQLGVAQAQAVSGGWQILGKEQGVVISTRQLAGEKHPVLRGQATIKGSILHVLAVVLDTKSSRGWVRGNDGIEIIRNVDDRVQYVHMLTELPWPIRDRDMIMKRSVTVVQPATEFRVRYLCAPKERKERSGHLRITTCDSHFTLKAVDANKTYVDYQVMVDPGGGLPDWGRRWMERRITVDTIARLERQVSRTGNQYEAVQQKWASIQK
jgi:hypothetical protein